MKNIVEVKNNQAVTDSVQVAKKFGKENSKVVRDIEKLLSEGSAKIGDTQMFLKSSYVHPQNKQTYKKYYMTKDGFTLLAFGFTGKKAKEFKLDYIQAFNKMESYIKKHNETQLPNSPEEKLLLTMEVTNRTVKRVESIEKDVNELKNNVVIDSGSYAAIGRLVSRRVYEFLDERRYQHNRENVSALFSDINHGIKQVTGVRTRSQIKSKDFEKVMQYIDAWEPATATKMELINKKVEA
ncbi:Phage regulatory protein, Rha family [Apilactobacillus kunkeei]|uniref:Rha family transcriptional regulator n=1 Tax=Apilactobacillus kunkeei TaxID=148814 RepID=UPI0006C5BC46|nr:Rha family transcriptional regulator [Apilactobacillus kunkeei]KOY73942.1 Phage regulatory protein, Rha family [Apilactobacillus kunkeei]